MPRVIHLHEAAPAKPRAGQPCNGCGVCCTIAPCPIGMLVSRKTTGTCSALTWVDDGVLYRCGIVTQPDRFLPAAFQFATGFISKMAQRYIAAGTACDCTWERQGAHETKHEAASA